MNTQNISIQSTKYDGSLHYNYPAMLVRKDTDLVIAYTPPGMPVKSYRGAMTTANHSLQLFWADRPYNLHVNWYADWQPRTHYINIASAATWHDGAIRFIDLDLDVIWRAATGEVILDDEDEFLEHQVRFGYPADLIAQTWRGCDEVRALIARCEYPFDGSLYAWRPDEPA